MTRINLKNPAFIARFTSRMLWQFVTLILLSALSAGCLDKGGDGANAQTTPRAVDFSDPQLSARLDAAFQQWASENGFKGAAVQVKSKDGYEWESAAGVVIEGAPTAYTTDTPMRVASVTKTMTAVVVLQLVEEGLLSLDTTLSEFVPDYPLADQITVKHLLQHRSGIYDITLDDKIFRNYLIANTSLWLSPQDVLAWTYGDTPDPAGAHPEIDSISQQTLIPRQAANAPGEGFHYSQPGFIALGIMIETVTGKPLARVFEERIFQRLGMSNTRLAEEDATENPVSYTYLFGATALGTNLLPSLNSLGSSSWAAGGVISTTHDLMMYFEALMTGELLSQSALQQMMGWVVSNAEPSGWNTIEYYGLGFSHKVRDGYSLRGHDGSMPGSGATMQHIDDIGVYVTATRNTDFYPQADARAPAKGTADLMERIKRALYNESQDTLLTE